MNEPKNPAESQTHRICEATTKAGHPCTRWAIPGSPRCLAHDDEAKKRAGFGGAQRVPNPKPLEVLRQRIEDDIDGWLAPLLRARDSDDGALALKAFSEAMNRLYGTPRQSMDVAHSGGVSIEALFSQDPLAETHTPLPEDDE